MKRDLCDT